MVLKRSLKSQQNSSLEKDWKVNRAHKKFFDGWSDDVSWECCSNIEFEQIQIENLKRKIINISIDPIESLEQSEKKIRISIYGK